MLLVEGEPGIGKSRFLRESSGAAVGRGFSVAGDADEPPVHLPIVELLPVPWRSAPAYAGGDRGAPRGGGQGRGRPGSLMPAGPAPCTAQGKSLIVFDDVHRADPMALQRLWGLPRQIPGRPALWLLARSTTTDGDVGRLFGYLERAGAVRMELGPLDDAAVAAMMAEELGATPQQDVLDLAAGAAGNPFLLAALLRGLQDEDAIRIDSGNASLMPAPLPQRLRAAVRCWLADLGPHARQFVEVGAVLGRSFQFDTAAALLGESPARLLPVLRAILTTGILTVTQDTLTFRQALLWQAVAEELPLPARRALHQQAGEFLIEHGAPAPEAAAHLISGSRLCAAQALSRLADAAGRMLAAAPEAAAELAASALALTGPADPARVPRTVLAVEALAAATRFTEAEGVARAALAGPLPLPVTEVARLRGLLSSALLCSGRPAAAAAEAEQVLSGPGLTARSRAEAGFALLGAYAGVQDARATLPRAEAVLGGDGALAGVTAGTLLVEAVNAWRAGRLGAALEQAREAARRGSTDPVAACRTLPPVLLAGMLLSLGCLADAAAVIRALQADAAKLGLAGRWPCPDILQACLALAEGGRQAAVARAESGLRIAEAGGCHLLSPAALSVLAAAALRAGDLRAAARLVADLQARAEHGPSFGWPHGQLVAAQVAEAQDGPRAAAALAAGALPLAAQDHGAVLAEPPGPAWLVRCALSQGDRRHASELGEAVRALAAGNPGFAALDAAAAHAHGLLERDAAGLGRAAAGHPGPWARASAAEDLGVLLAGQRDFKQAGGSLEAALAGYEEADAGRDGRRVRRRLRALGIRHRHHAPPSRRPRSGWASLTETERAVSGLVAQGLTNQQVASEMFLSAHTVAFHLRQVYRKLGIGSRVDLTRLLAERGGATGTVRAS
jgi:DNA-binding CsgD family transcriptional regulator